MKKIVIIGDIIRSKNIPDRAAVQQMLANIIGQINKNNPNIASAYTITLGDEFQAVLNSAKQLFQNMISILLALAPVQVRFSIAIGSIDTPINKKQAIGMDGPAFYLARQGIETLKQTPNLIVINGLDTSIQNLVNQSLYLLSHNLLKWKATRLNVLSLMQKKHDVAEIARLLQLSDKTIYKTIDHGNLKTVTRIFEEIERMIDHELIQ